MTKKFCNIAASVYVFTNDMLRDVVVTEAGDARRRLFHRRVLEILEAAGDSAAVLAHHAQAAGLAQAAFHHSQVAGREALRLQLYRRPLSISSVLTSSSRRQRWQKCQARRICAICISSYAVAIC